MDVIFAIVLYSQNVSMEEISYTAAAFLFDVVTPESDNSYLFTNTILSAHLII